MSQLPPLSLLPLAEYRAQRAHVFPSDESLRWFIRANRDDLVRRGALVMPTGRKMVSPEPFDRAVLEIGSRHAARRQAGRIYPRDAA
ncbi:MAG: hypothetical protein KF683_00865 [Rubrivivax sp.]|nr:hypothetical protein [Rubrivivax sp.]